MILLGYWRKYQMDTQFNQDPPTVMHIDLNSCFATVEQQAHIHLRGRPIVIAAYTSPGGCILAPSIEAKKLGIKTGMRVRDAQNIYPDVIVRGVDPLLVRDVHKKFKKICLEYSPNVVPKSIDEVVIDFDNTPALDIGLKNIGIEIKKRMRSEIGEWISCNVGISTNRFLAKLASSLHKPDGLDVITYKNIKNVYSSIKLTDFNGINTRYEARLNAQGIFTPLDFLSAEGLFLKKQVFQSIVGHYWYLRIRGFETDVYESKQKSFGQEYSLGEKTADPEKLAGIIMMLTEKMGRRLRASENAAYGIHFGISYADWTFWHRGKKFKEPLYTTKELFGRVMEIFSFQENKKIVSKISVSCFELLPIKYLPASLFETEIEKKRKVSLAIDKINDCYGEYIVAPALMMESKKKILDRIAFGK